MRSKRLKLTAVLVGFLFLGSVVAAPSPLPLMKDIAQDMISALKRNKDRLSGNTALVNRIVNRVLIPHIDIYSMSGRVIGRKYWLQASPSERKAFSDLFKHKVLSTYSSALSSYDKDRVLFYPLRQPGRSYAQVRSVIVRKSGQKIPVSYSLRYRAGTWKVVDLSVENVSIVNNYKAQYSGALSEGGLKYLISKMRRRG
jgi:phospholipid transport system substrate-binding protein